MLHWYGYKIRTSRQEILKMLDTHMPWMSEREGNVELDVEHNSPTSARCEDDLDI